MQETRVRSLVPEDVSERLSPCATTTEPVLQSPGSTTTEPTAATPEAPAPQSLHSARRDATATREAHTATKAQPRARCSQREACAAAETQHNQNGKELTSWKPSPSEDGFSHDSETSWHKVYSIESAMKKTEDTTTLVFSVDVKANKQQSKQAVKRLQDTDEAKIHDYQQTSAALGLLPLRTVGAFRPGSCMTLEEEPFQLQMTSF
ncbi:hypothetical protein MJG53_011489 [Ovis ammon polii x Ovis aries]|uniref:Uncharacterized protein n=1 Tax=Ovis ammon polii x Ovis aries TaxID=2918886 RepID=A0ACB9UNS5_9CETA|nr:hypothetical protein MJG53_011489 [Ovis ammon polii x Ovis aries]